MARLQLSKSLVYNVQRGRCEDNWFATVKLDELHNVPRYHFAGNNLVLAMHIVLDWLAEAVDIVKVDDPVAILLKYKLQVLQDVLDFIRVATDLLKVYVECLMLSMVQVSVEEGLSILVHRCYQQVLILRYVGKYLLKFGFVAWLEKLKEDLVVLGLGGGLQMRGDELWISSPLGQTGIGQVHPVSCYPDLFLYLFVLPFYLLLPIVLDAVDFYHFDRGGRIGLPVKPLYPSQIELPVEFEHLFVPEYRIRIQDVGVYRLHFRLGQILRGGDEEEIDLALWWKEVFIADADMRVIFLEFVFYSYEGRSPKIR